jgi:hypothetical protein
LTPGEFLNAMPKKYGENKLIDRVRNKEVLQRVKGDGNILQTIKPKKPTWICYILPWNCHLRHVTEGMIKRGI